MALLLVVLVLGMVLPRFVTGTGVDRYQSDKRQLAEQALTNADVYFAGEPPNQIALTAQRVATIGTCRRHPSDMGDGAFDALQGEVLLYTIFGIPYGTLRFQCEGSQIIRCPHNTAECPHGQNAAIDENLRNRKNHA